MRTFIRDKNFVSPEWGGGGVPKKSFHWIIIIIKNFWNNKKQILGDIARLDKNDCFTIWRKVWTTPQIQNKFQRTKLKTINRDGNWCLD